MCTSWILITLFLFHEHQHSKRKNPYPFSDVTPTRSCHDLKHHHFHHPTSTTNQRQSRHRNETNWKSKKRKKKNKEEKKFTGKRKEVHRGQQVEGVILKRINNNKNKTTRTTRIKRLKNKKKQKLCIGTPCSHLQLTWTILVSSVTPAKLIRLGHNLPVVSPVPSIPNLFRPKEWTSDMPTVGGLGGKDR